MARRKRSDRVGDVLGLGGTGSSTGTTTPDNVVSHASDEEQRRRRMSEGADEVTPTATGTTPSRSSGATGIDMGSGGEGTDLE
jgi:hypothetical protein